MREWKVFAAVYSDTLESSRNDDGNINDNPTNQCFDWLDKEK